VRFNGNVRYELLGLDFALMKLDKYQLLNVIVFYYVCTKAFFNCTLIVDVEYSHVRFLGNLVLNLWDCGG